MLERAEVDEAGADVGGGHVAGERAGRGGQGVLDVVLAKDGELILVHEPRVGAVDAHDERAVLVEPGGAGLVVAREFARAQQTADAKAALGAAARDVAAPLVAVGDDGQVAGVEVGEQLLLGRRVVLHGVVPVEVVGRDVEQHAHVRVQALGGGQLEARELGHEPLAGGTARHLADGHGADVADGLGRKAARAQQVAGERGRGGLAVRAGDAHPALGAHAPGKLGLADDLVCGRLGARVEVAELGDAGRAHGEVVVALDVLGAKDHLGTGAGQGAGGLVGLALEAAVDGHAGHAAALALLEQVVGHGLPRLAKPQHQHVAQIVAADLAHRRAPSHIAMPGAPLGGPAYETSRGPLAAAPGTSEAGSTAQSPRPRTSR